MDPSAKLTATLKEVEEIRAAIEATRGAIYTAFGVVLPGVVGVFVLASGHGKEPVGNPSTLAAAFVILTGLGVMWTQNLWMELLRYVRYYYVVLMPRVYQASDQASLPNFLEWSGRRSLRSWVPVWLFNLGALVIVIGVYRGYVTSPGWSLHATCIGFIAGMIVSWAAVMLEVRETQRLVLRIGSHGNSSPTRAT